jgi:hypothetical protein
MLDIFDEVFIYRQTVSLVHKNCFLDRFVCPVFDVDVDKCNNSSEIREQLSNGGFSRRIQFRIVS